MEKQELQKKEVIKEIAIIPIVTVISFLIMSTFMSSFFLILLFVWILIAAPMYSVYNHTKLNTYLVLPTVWISIPIIFIGLIEPGSVIPPLAPFWAGFFILFGFIIQGVFVCKEYKQLRKLGIARKKLSLKDQLLGKVPQDWDRYNVIGDILDNINK